MARIYADRVMESTVSTGTGDIALAGGVLGYQRFAGACAIGDTVDYAIVAVDTAGVPTGAWETGRGTYSAANTLSRTTRHASSTGAVVNFEAGTKLVLLTENAATLAGLLSDAPTDGKLYARQSAMWAEIQLPTETRAFRYWGAFNMLADNTGFTSINEFQFRAQSGGLPIPGGTPTGSPAYSGFPLSNAFDGGDNFYGVASGNTFLYIDYGAPVVVAELAIKSRTQANETPRTGVIRGSNDGVNWVDICPLVFPAWGSNEFKTLAIPVISTTLSVVGEAPEDGNEYVRKNAAWKLNRGLGPVTPHKYWALRNVRANGGPFTLDSIAFFNGAIALDTTNIIPSSKDNYQNNPDRYGARNTLGYVWDGQINYYSNSDYGFLAYEFPAPVAVTSIQISANNVTGPGMREWDWCWSDNGVNWTTLTRSTTSEWTNAVDVFRAFDYTALVAGYTADPVYEAPNDGNEYVRKNNVWASPTRYGRNDTNPGPTAPYWRINVPAGIGFYAVGAMDIAFLTATSGADLAVGGTAIGGPADAGNPITNAFDNDVTSKWLYTSGGPNGTATATTVGYHFPFPVAVDRVAITANPASIDDARQTPNKFTVEYSMDGVTWLVAWAYLGNPFVPNETRVIAGPFSIGSDSGDGEAELTGITLLNGWTDLNADYTGARAVKQGKLVHIVCTLTGGTLNSVVFNLPVGWRPSQRTILPAINNGKFGYCEVRPDGDVVAYSSVNNLDIEINGSFVIDTSNGLGRGVPEAPKDGQRYERQGGAWVVASAGGGGGGSEYIVPLFYAAAPAASQVLLDHIFPRQVTFPAGFDGSRMGLGTLSSAGYSVSLQRNGVEVATGAVNPDGSSTFASGTGDIQFNAGDVLSVVVGANPDQAVRRLRLTLRGS